MHLHAFHPQASTIGSGRGTVEECTVITFHIHVIIVLVIVSLQVSPLVFVFFVVVIIHIVILVKRHVAHVIQLDASCLWLVFLGPSAIGLCQQLLHSSCCCWCRSLPAVSRSSGTCSSSRHAPFV